MVFIFVYTCICVYIYIHKYTYISHVSTCMRLYIYILDSHMAPVKPHKVSLKKCRDFESDFEGVFEVLSSIISQHGVFEMLTSKVEQNIVIPKARQQ